MSTAVKSTPKRKTVPLAELLPLRSIPLNKSALVELAQTYAAGIRTDADKFLLLVAVKAAEEYLKALKAAIADNALTFAKAQRANGIHTTETGVKFSIRTESTWDFSADTTHTKLSAQLEQTKVQLKAREEFLKKLILPIVENEIEVVPPRMSESKTSLAITLPA